MKEFIYPKKSSEDTKHKKTIEKLLNGTFLSFNSELYDFLYEYKDWYKEFFLKSFGIELIFKYETFYLVNENNDSKFAQKLLTRLAILMYEIEKKNLNPVQQIREKAYDINYINNLLQNSVQFSDIGESLLFDKNYITKLSNLGLASKISNDSFMFTDAIEIFLNEFESIKHNVLNMNENNSEDFDI